MPGPLDGAVMALDRFGTRNLSEVLQPAIDLAARGHPIDHLVAKWIEDSKAILARWPGSAKAFLPGGRPPRPGDVWVQPEYAETLRKIAQGEQRALANGRSAALQAARDVSYKGEIAKALDAFSRENGGLIRYEDLPPTTPGWRSRSRPPAPATRSTRWGRGRRARCCSRS